MNRTWLLRALLALALAGAAFWLLRHTEWEETREPIPLSDELAADGTHVARVFLQRLGLQARTVEGLGTLPPAGATLVLTAAEWDLFAGTPERVRRWVEAGGHLVIDSGLVPFRDDESWLPVRWPGTRNADHAPDPAVELRRPRAHFDWCRVLRPRPGGTSPWADDGGFVACLRPGDALELPARGLLWALQSEEVGLEAVRVAVGRGRLTVFSGAFHFSLQGQRERLMNLSNRGLLEGDNAALFAALVDARAGGDVWIVPRLDRAPLPLWLAQHAAPVLLLAAVALALTLWRAGARFGPLAAPPPPLRRSLMAQVRGLGDFLLRHQPQALHAAALRALDETATAHIPGWRGLGPRERAAALARRTALPEMRVAAALQAADSPAAWTDALALLETARRALHTPRRP